jgi:hypothetical protein
MSLASESFCDGLKSDYTGTAVDWMKEEVKLPFSARSTRFDPEMAPWLNKIIAACDDDSITKVVVRAPTGGAKTTLLEVFIPYVIAQKPGPMLLIGQNDESVKEWSESRLTKVLESCKPVAQLFPSNVHNKRKTAILFPHMDLFLGGANMSSLQEKSMRYCYGDETWQWKPGMIGEMKARHHDRWNRKTILVTQGWEFGHEMDKEFDSCSVDTWGFHCKKCGDWQPYLWGDDKKKFGVCYDEKRDDSGEVDWDATARTVYYQCSHCSESYADTSAHRRQMSSVADYVTGGRKGIAGQVAFTYPAYAVWWIPWITMVQEWVNANEQKKFGHLEPLKQFIQKRKAEVWVEEEMLTGDDLDATKGGFNIGDPWPDEAERYLTNDVQEEGGRHFFSGVGAFAADGRARVLWAGRLESWEEARSKQLEYEIRGMRVGSDAAHETQEVESMCARHGWISLIGDDRLTWNHPDPNNKGQFIERPYSPHKKIVLGLGTKQQGHAGFCYRFFWSNPFFKDLVHRRMHGKGLPLDVADDIDDAAGYTDGRKKIGFWDHMRANQKIKKYNKTNGQFEIIWTRIGKRPDHYLDMVRMLLVLAAIGGCLGISDVPMRDKS